MKKLLLILSALLFITGCEVESTSNANPNPPVEDDEYSDGIYLFVASYLSQSYKKLRIQYIYNDNTEEYFINFEETSVSEIVKVDVSNLKVIKAEYPSSPDNPDTGYGGGIEYLNKDSFAGLENGLYVAEIFREDYTDVYLRKTKSIEHYLKNENFYDYKNVLFITISNGSENVRYKKINGKVINTLAVHKGNPKGIILYNPPRTSYVGASGSKCNLDCTTLQLSNGNTLDLTQLGEGYYCTEIKDGNFTWKIQY